MSTRARAEFGPSFGVVDEIGQCGDERAVVALDDCQAGLPVDDQFGDPGHRGRDDGQTTCHCLHQRDRDALHLAGAQGGRREHEHVGSLQHGCHLRRREATVHRHDIAEVELDDQLFDSGSFLAVTDDVEVNPTTGPVDVRQRQQSESVPFSLLQARDHRDVARRRGGPRDG